MARLRDGAAALARPRVVSARGGDEPPGALSSPPRRAARGEALSGPAKDRPTAAAATLGGETGGATAGGDSGAAVPWGVAARAPAGAGSNEG